MSEIDVEETVENYAGDVNYPDEEFEEMRWLGDSPYEDIRTVRVVKDAGPRP